MKAIMILERVWRISKPTPNSQGSLWTFQLLTTKKKHICCFCAGFLNSTEFGVSLERVWREFGESLENLQLTPNTLLKKNRKMQTYELRAGLEWVWPNSLQTHSCYPKKKLKKQKWTYTFENTWVWTRFGVSLENLQAQSKLTPFYPKN